MSARSFPPSRRAIVFEGRFDLMFARSPLFKENTMKLAMLGGAIAICAATAIVAAQAPAAPTDQTQTVLGCLKGEGTAQSPWVLAGVVIPPPAPAGAGRGGGGGRGAGRGGGAGAAG